MLVGLALFGLSGCKSTQERLKPPKIPEEYVAPPDNDKRYSEPIEYPKDALNQDRKIYPDFVPPNAPGGSGSGGSRSPISHAGGSGGPGGPGS
jgi:hypothetical protein